MRTRNRRLIWFWALLWAAAVSGQGTAPIVYPQKGQDQAQQQKDSGECSSWAKNQTGFDPMAPPPAQPVPPAEAPQGGLVRGAARGAALGAIIDGGDGAATGAAVGAAVGGMRRRDQRRRQQAQQQQAQQQRAQRQAELRANYNRAFAACMEGRGYTVR